MLVRALERDVEQLGDALDLRSELPIQLVAPDTGEVVAARVEEGILEVDACSLERERLARTCALVDLEQSLVPRRDQLALVLPLAFEKIEMTDEAVQERLVLVTEGAQHHEQREAALAGDAGAGAHVAVRLRLDVELDPLAAVGVNRAGDDRLLVTTRLEDHAGRAHELAHHDPLGPVDDEGAPARHHGEVPHEDRLLLDLAGGAVHERRPDEDRGGVGDVLRLALVDRELGWWPEIRIGRVKVELQAQLVSEVRDRADVAERLGKPTVEEPLEGIALNRDQVGQGQNLVNICKRETLRSAGT